MRLRDLGSLILAYYNLSFARPLLQEATDTLVFAPELNNITSHIFLSLYPPLFDEDDEDDDEAGSDLQSAQQTW
jgi:hypothetical protein